MVYACTDSVVGLTVTEVAHSCSAQSMIVHVLPDLQMYLQMCLLLLAEPAMLSLQLVMAVITRDIQM